jgi:hypothetical protein
MVLYLENDTPVKALQDKFNALYPFLQLHFIKTFREDGKPLKKIVKGLPEQRLSEITGTLVPGMVSIEGTCTVAEILDNFRSHGLAVQVYRKSGTLWVETSLTEDWTLERQNREAYLFSATEDFFTEKIRKIL